MLRIRGTLGTDRVGEASATAAPRKKGRRASFNRAWVELRRGRSRTGGSVKKVSYRREEEGSDV